MKKFTLFLLSCFLAPSVFALHFDSDGFAKSLGGWEGKKGKDMSTMKYSWSGSSFRTHRPVVSRTPEGGIFVTSQIHQLSAVATDVCVLEMTFDASGELLAAQAKIRMGRNAYDTQLVKPEPLAPVPEGAIAPATPARSEVIATELFKKLDSEVAKWNDTLTGQKTRKDLIGRLTQNSRRTQNVRVNFSGAVRHNFNLIAGHVRSGSPYADNADK